MDMKYKLILASQSPRRQELLGGLDWDFEVRVLKGINESYPQGLTCEEIPKYISRVKAEAYRASMAADELIITADTIVWVDGQVLGKPANATEAEQMLQLLSGRTHQVATGVTLLTQHRQQSFASVSNVTFAELTPQEITYYIEKYRPMDKAGAYGIQEWIGYIGVERIEGSYFNVMGLPVQRLYHEMKTFLQLENN